jgi:EAL domain-containing protein (putative c-di-GMP-specific phosphodiesterase class I)
VSDIVRASRFAERLDAIGCQFALDDFGTGYAALTYLKHLPIRYLKIDRDFIRDLAENPRSRAVVSAIVTLAAGFGQRTIAEGVENAATLALLRELGVDLAQGFTSAGQRRSSAARIHRLRICSDIQSKTLSVRTYSASS